MGLVGLSRQKPCPKRLVDKMWEILHEEHLDKDDTIKYYKSVVPDERAYYVMQLDEVLCFYTLRQLHNYINNNKINIKNEMDLDIY